MKQITSSIDQERIARAVREVLSHGFEESHKEMVILKNIPFYSLYEHHFLPFHGHAHLGYVPEGSLVGTSKIARVVDISSRTIWPRSRFHPHARALLHCAC